MLEIECLDKIVSVSRIPREEIIKIIAELPCSCAYAFRFYCTFVRFPTLHEARHVAYNEIFSYWQRSRPPLSQHLAWIQKAKEALMQV